MVKRKAAKKKAVSKKISPAKKVPVKKAAKEEPLQLPMAAFLMQILAVILVGILIVALTLYVLGKMPARGFWFLTVLLAVIAFVVMPVMRKKFLGQI